MLWLLRAKALCAALLLLGLTPKACLGFEGGYKVDTSTGEVKIEAYSGTEGQRVAEPGVLVLVDGKELGKTDAQGRFVIRWLMEGKHKLELVRGEETLSSTLEIPRVVRAKFLDHWFEDQAGNRLDAFGLKQDVLFITKIQNTGTSLVDAWEIKDTCPGFTSCADVKITTPPLPVWLTRPVISAIFKDLRIGTVYEINGGTLITKNAFSKRTNNPGKAFVRGEFPKDGIKPGETITVVQPWSYWGFFQPQMLENMAIDKGLKGGNSAISYRVKDLERGVIEGSIKEYTMLGITRRNIGFEASYRGQEHCCTLWLIVEGKPQDSRSLQACYRLGKSFKRD